MYTGTEAIEGGYESGVRIVISAITRITMIVGATMYIPVLVAIYYGETTELRVFFATATAVLVLSYAVSRLLPQPRSLTIGEALFVSGFGWIIVSFIGGIPYVYTIHMSWVDAFFETMSGFTTTGMTLIKIIEGNPYSVLFWRAFTQWLGGAGIIMLFIIIIVSSTRDATLWRLYTAEARDVRIRASTLATVKRIWLIYLFYTLLAIVTLRLLGMNWFDSVTHSFTSLATGGFSTRTASIAAYHSLGIELALVFFSFMGGVNFLAHYILFTKGLRNFLKYYEVKWALFVVALSTSMISLDLLIHSGEPLDLGVRQGLFQTISIMTTTGYTTVDINLWPPLSKFILLILMFVGGNMCSTGGAIKIGRIVIAVKAFFNQLKLLLLPRGALSPVKVNERPLDSHEVQRVLSFIAGYLLIIVLGTVFLTFFGYDAFSSLSAVASAQGNVGPCYLDLFETNSVVRVVLSLLMWIGRLEVLPAIILFLPSSWKHLLAKKPR